jgi:ABC-type transport system involved in multi-copper enzyme maturation permease subunit
MNAATADQRHAPALLTGRPGVPFARLVRTELRKLTDTRASRWLLAAITAITPIVVAVMLFAAKPHDLTYNKLVDYTQTPQKILLPALGILAMTSEWSQRTGLVTFTLEPDRKRVLLAKTAATLLLGLLVIVITFTSAAIGNLLGEALRDGDGSWAFGIAGFRDISLVLFTGLAQGLAFGMLLLISAAAIIAYYVLPNLSSLLFGSVPGLKDTGRWVDLNQAQGSLYDHHMTGEHWAQVVTATLIWVVLPAVLGVLRVLRTEVKSS